MQAKPEPFLAGKFEILQAAGNEPLFVDVADAGHSSIHTLAPCRRFGEAGSVVRLEQVAA